MDTPSRTLWGGPMPLPGVVCASNSARKPAVSAVFPAPAVVLRRFHAGSLSAKITPRGAERLDGSWVSCHQTPSQSSSSSAYTVTSMSNAMTRSSALGLFVRRFSFSVPFRLVAPFAGRTSPSPWPSISSRAACSVSNSM